MATAAKCADPECSAPLVEGLPACLAHLDEGARAAYLAQVRAGRTLDARGMTISAELFEQVTRHHRRQPEPTDRYLTRMEEQRAGAPAATPGLAHFDDATFEAGISLDGLDFPQGASFQRAHFADLTVGTVVFGGPVSFAAALFTAPADFGQATFDGDATFDRADFRREALFSGVRFEQEATFRHTRFGDVASFGNDTDHDGAGFGGTADFSAAQFSGPAYFGQRSGSAEGDFRFDRNGPASFSGQALFTGCTFAGAAAFDRAEFGLTDFARSQFTEAVSFAECHFRHLATFDRAEFTDLLLHDARFGPGASFVGIRVSGLLELANVRCAGDLKFDEAVLGGRTDLTLLHVKGRLWFIRSQFERSRDLGPIAALDKLDLDHATFHENVRIEVAAARVLCRKTNFRDGVYLLARWAQVSLDEARFGGPAVLVGAPSKFEQIEEEPLATAHRGDGRPSLVSVRRANVANLSVTNVDLRPARFTQAQNLDQMRLGDPVQLPGTPERIWWSARNTIAEEHLWRRKYHRGRRRSGWYPDACEIPQWARDEIPDEAGEPTLDPHELASIYRQLRKGREDSKDEPGAADFYYGEMEMRRKATVPPGARLSKRFSLYAERAILWCYWAVSGYGLRASRALLALGLTILVFALALLVWGFPARHGYSFAVLYSAESVTSLLHAPDVALTSAGEWLSIGLRLLGPLFFGLMILSLRGRVHR